MNKVFSFKHGSDFHNYYIHLIIDTRESKRHRTENTDIEVPILSEVSVQRELRQCIELTEDQNHLTKEGDSSVTEDCKSSRFGV